MNWKKKDDEDFLYEEEGSIEEVLTNYFSNLFESSNPQDMEEVTGLVEWRVNEETRDFLGKNFSKEEISYALFDMHPTKAPKIDEMHGLFYQKFCHLVGEDVTRLVLQVLNQDPPSDLNETLIMLIPKFKKPLHASEFRPISLCNALFKVIEKPLSNRLKGVLGNIIGEYHSAFVPNIIITNNGLLAFECVPHFEEEII